MYEDESLSNSLDEITFTARGKMSKSQILALAMLLFFWVIPILFYIGFQLLAMYWSDLMGTNAREDPRSLGERFPKEGK